MSENGHRNLTWRWLAGIAVTMLLGIGSYLFAQTQRRIDRTEEQTIAVQALVAETRELAKTDHARIDAMDARLTRIENKLDRLLERPTR